MALIDVKLIESDHAPELRRVIRGAHVAAVSICAPRRTAPIAAPQTSVCVPDEQVDHIPAPGCCDDGVVRPCFQSDIQTGRLR
jgi:hypothetical protein